MTTSRSDRLRGDQVGGTQLGPRPFATVRSGRWACLWPAAAYLISRAWRRKLGEIVN